MKKFRTPRQVRVVRRWELGELIGVSESFLLFSQALPSQDLGFIDPKATSLDIVVAGKDMIIQQSPAILSSDRKNGTTGAGGLSPLVDYDVKIVMMSSSPLEDYPSICRLDSVRGKCSVQDFYRRPWFNCFGTRMWYLWYC